MTAAPRPSSPPTKTASARTASARTALVRTALVRTARAGAGAATQLVRELKAGYGRNDVRGDHLERGDLPDVGHRADRDLEAELGQLAEPVDHLAGFLALLPDIEDEVAGLGDRVVVAALGLAVRAQHVQLPGQVRAGEQ